MDRTMLRIGAMNMLLHGIEIRVRELGRKNNLEKNIA